MLNIFVLPNDIILNNRQRLKDANSVSNSSVRMQGLIGGIRQRRIHPKCDFLMGYYVGVQTSLFYQYNRDSMGVS